MVITVSPALSIKDPVLFQQSELVWVV